MNNEHTEAKASPPGKRKNNATLLRILVPVLIVAVLAGIYFLKNADDSPAAAPSASNAAGANGVDYSTAEFALDATEDFDMDKILSYGLPVIVDFGADECIPCKQMAPVLKELNEELRGKVIVKFVDVWKNPDAAQSVPLSTIPTQFFFNADGTPYVPADEKAAVAQGFTMYSLKDSGKHVFTAHVGGLDKEAILAVLVEMGAE